MNVRDLCPKCSEAEVDHYICTTCGYIETHIEDKGRLEVVAKDWKKVG
jgi:ribosomal protein L32